MQLTGKKELLPEHEMLNNYDQHVHHCPSCSKVPVISPLMSHPGSLHLWPDDCAHALPSLQIK